MTSEVNPSIIKRTQDSLGKIIKRPTLTEKLLARPPFRFLHDIITAYIKTTGLMKGLFSSDQLFADNVKEKEAKLAFLQKVIDYLALVHGKPVPVRTMSIIAGKEPERTNELLVLLAEAANKQVKNDEIIARLLSNTLAEAQKTADVNSAPRQRVEQPTPRTGENVEEQKKSKREKEKTGEDKTRQTTPTQKPVGYAREANEVATERKSAKDTESRRHGERKSTEKIRPEGDQNKDDKQQQQQRSKHHRRPESRCDATPAVDKPTEGERASSNTDPASPVNPTALQKETTKSTPQLRHAKPPSAKGAQQQKEAVHQGSPESNAPKPTPVSVADDEVADAASTGNVGLLLPAARVRRGLAAGEETRSEAEEVNQTVTGLIIHENDNDSADESSEDQPIVVEETVGADTEGVHLDGQNSKLDTIDGEHGGLVTKILQSKKEFETGNLMPQQKSDGVSKGKVADAEAAARLREQAAVEKEVERLCEALQALSRSALPLGKLMDFVQEDLDSMQQEYEGWVAENNQLRAKLAEEERLTLKVTDPLKTKLAELHAEAEGHRQAIGNCRAKIMQNEERIQQIITRSHQVS